MDRIFAAAGLQSATPRIALEVNAAVRSAAVTGIVPAVRSSATVRNDLALGHLVEVHLADADLHRRLRAIWPKTHALPTPAAELPRIGRGFQARRTVRVPAG